MSRVEEWMYSKEWQAELKQELSSPCPHGIFGGIAKDLCEECRAQRLRDEKERRIKEQEKLQEEIRQYETRAAAVRFNQNQYKVYINRQSRNIDFLRSVPPQKFEDLVAEMFSVLGWAVQQTPYTNDSGMDAILVKDDRKFLLECKRYGRDNVVGRPTLNAFLGVITAQKAEGGFFVTTSRFSSPAREFATANGITPIDSMSLLLMMDKAYPVNEEVEVLQLMCSVCGDVVDFQDADNEMVSYEKGRFCRNEHLVEGESLASLLRSKMSVQNTKVVKPAQSRTAKRPSRKPYRRHRRRY